MLTHFIGILCLSSFCSADVPSRLFAVSHLKGMIHELQDSLVDFKRNATQALTELETMGRRMHKDNKNCLDQISKAHNASRKLLNMLVNGEHYGLQTAEESLEQITLNEIGQLWGALGPGGKSRVQLKEEMDNFEGTAITRIREAIRDCGTTENSEDST